MEVDCTNLVTHLLITVQYLSYYRLFKNPSVKIWSHILEFQMVRINNRKLCASL